MKKKHLKILALVVAFASIIGLGLFANAFLGNPLSKMLAKSTAQNYLTVTYSDTDYYIDRVSYNFKDGNYNAYIKSPTSIDTEFTLSITMFGKLQWNSYEDVITGSNTARRIDQEYRELTDTLFNNPSFPYTCYIGFGTLEIYPAYLIENADLADVPSYALNQDELVLDKIYNIQELGRQAGHLVIYVEDDTVTIERAAKIMLDIKDQFDAAGIPFAAMDFTLQYPRPEEGQRPEGEVGVADFPYDEIYEDGMTDRVTEADKALKAYYEEQDAKKQ
ncbi:MAG: hypothetical protein J6J03_02960 [Tyzzerella sp.]|nr:hypothetical protein [Tyzzerella sp.]